MELTWLYFLCGCVGVLALSFAAHRDERLDAVLVAMLLLAGWAATNVPALCYGIDFTHHPRPVILTYVIQAAIIGASWAAQPANWKMAILFAILDKAILIVFHVPTPWAGHAIWSVNRHDYVLSMNILFAVELVCASWPGGRNGIELLARRWRLFYHRWNRRLLSPVGRQSQSQETPR